MDAGLWMALLGSLAVIALAALEFLAYGGILGWMEYRDRRSARTREEAEDDLREYGPSAIGLRDELLGPEDRATVLAARKRVATTHAGRW
jgi:hypothetical protein